MTVGLSTWAGVSAAAAAAWGSTYYATYAVRSQWLGRTAWRGPADSNAIALTFDDGPAGDTEAILEVLAAHGVPATFFMIGERVERHAPLVRRVVAAGHEIGNHSYSHPIYLYRSAGQTYEELRRTQAAIAAAAGVTPAWARPPCGVRSRGYFRAAAALGLRTVQWSATGFDWKNRAAASIATEVLRGVSPGGIVLLHDGAPAGRRDRRETTRSLPAIIDGVRGMGLRFAALSDLLGVHTETTSGSHDA
jgi:peptidoglycan/xylan/chitin deacetylase (PgdA/CDA1 family)